MRVLKGRAGKVSLVGAGPGDPDLITVKGLKALRQADVVVYDRLVNPLLLDRVRKDAELIYVGKRGGHYSCPQSEINRILVDRARKGARVVRLKGGDPFLFGRGGEEVLHLGQEGVPFEIIPGVSAAIAAPAAVGIPVTHRGVASSVAVISGHQTEGPENPINWSGIAQAADTLVVLMPLVNLRQIVGRLISEGRSITTPAAVIQSGTCFDQRLVTAPLKEIAAAAERAGIASPATLVVGEVVSLAFRIRESAPASDKEAGAQLAEPGAAATMKG